MKHDRPDGQIEGQMTIDDLLEPSERLVAVSRIFARARQQMTINEQKAFIFALSQIKFTERPKDNFVLLNKKKLAAILGIKGDPDHLSVNLYRSIENLAEHSYIEIEKGDIGKLDIQGNGRFISNVWRVGKNIYIEFASSYFRLFTELNKDNPDYITMWSSDIFQMKSVRSVKFYEYLRQITDTRNNTQTVIWGIQKFKEEFGIPKEGKGSYMRTNGGFDRKNFEKYVIDPLCDDFKGCRMINLTVQPDGKLYEKVKQGNRVLGYRFSWTFSKYPAVATATEMKEIQKRVDQDPVVLKIAKDIVKGEKKTKSQKNKFNNFPGRQYDYAELEKAIINKKADDK